jgi:hypothetical protein
MLVGMQTIDTNTLVSGLFEPCAAYATGLAASPVCTTCGWLDVEHETTVAEVHDFPARRRRSATPKRLAS